MKSNNLMMCFLCMGILLNAQEWEEVSPMPDNFRTDHSIGFALDGKGYIVTGGNSGNFIYSNFYEYDPSTDTWTEKEPHPAGARGFGIGDVYDGKLYMGFGVSTSAILKDLWVYDGEKWEELSPCDCPARYHPAFTIKDGKIYVGLGNNNSGNLNDWWVYDIETDKWSQLPDLPSANRHHPYQFSIGDYVYAGLGHGSGDPSIYNNWFQYDPESVAWNEVSSLPAEGRVAGAQFEHGEYGYVLSGEGEDHRAMLTGEFWKYDPELDFWDELVPHPGQSRWAPATFILEDYVYLINGSTRVTSYEYPAQNYRYYLGQGPTSTDDFGDLSMAIDVYPNPVSNYINIDITNADDVEIQSMKLVDIMGKEMKSIPVGTKRIDVTTLPTGQYNIVFVIDSKSYTKTFIKG